MNIVTREKMIEYLANAEPERAKQYIGRALVVLLNRQTQEEAKANVTRNHNFKGFTPADARSGSIAAKYFLKYRTLQDWQIEKWTKPNRNGVPRIAKYWKQLDQAAKAKAANKQ